MARAQYGRVLLGWLGSLYGTRSAWASIIRLAWVALWPKLGSLWLGVGSGEAKRPWWDPWKGVVLKYCFYCAKRT